MLLISQLLSLWHERLSRLRGIAADPHAPPGNEWLVRMRLRILGFLVSRYSDPVAARRQDALADLTPRTLDSCQFEVEPFEVGPRPRAQLGEKLRAIHQSNFEAWRVRRWRWFL